MPLLCSWLQLLNYHDAKRWWHFTRVFVSYSNTPLLHLIHTDIRQETSVLSVCPHIIAQGPSGLADVTTMWLFNTISIMPPYIFTFSGMGRDVHLIILLSIGFIVASRTGIGRSYCIVTKQANVEYSYKTSAHSMLSML